MALFFLARVTGSSMWPRLREGDRVIASSLPYFLKKPRVGDLVVAHHPLYSSQLIVKKISQVDATTVGARFFLSSEDQLAGEDSYSFGCIPQDLIKGKVLFVIHRKK